MPVNNWIRCVVVYDDYSAMLSVNYDKPCAENCRCQSDFTRSWKRGILRSPGRNWRSYSVSPTG